MEAQPQHGVNLIDGCWLLLWLAAAITGASVGYSYESWLGLLVGLVMGAVGAPGLVWLLGHLVSLTPLGDWGKRPLPRCSKGCCGGQDFQFVQLSNGLVVEEYKCGEQVTRTFEKLTKVDSSGEQHPYMIWGGKAGWVKDPQAAA